MRLGWIVAAAGLLLALVWLLRSPQRSAGTRSAAAPADERAVPGLELSEPARLGETPGTPSSAAPGDAALRRKPEPARPGATAAVAPTVAPIHGRLVVRESGDPIEGSFSVRLRTIDLLRAEDLRTRPDGSFRGTTLFPRSVVLALVKDEEGRELVDHEARFEPSSEDEWLVRVPESAWPTFARGVVVDPRGKPLEEAMVKLVPLAPGLPPAETSIEEDGRFFLESLRAGPYRLQVHGRWARAEPLELALRTGPNELGLVVVPEPAPGGDLVLTIEADAPGVPVCAFELADEGGGLRQRFDSSLGTVTEKGELWLVVSELPAGSYTLAVRALDGRSYAPESLRFSPPARLALRATGAGHPGHTFRARDAESGAALTGFSVFGRRGRTWRHHAVYRQERVESSTRIGVQSVPQAEVHLAPGYDAWVVSARGYRAALGSFAGAGPVLEVALEPGWSELYQFEDASGAAFAPARLQRFLEPAVLEGVQVLADGVLAGTSDADGFFALSADAEPDALEFRRPGWFPSSEYRLDILRTVELVQLR